jgi:hypothetical protein
MATKRTLYEERLKKALAEIKPPTFKELLEAGDRLFARERPVSSGHVPLPWCTRGSRSKSVRWEYAPAFNARGMKRLYGRADHFGTWTANMGMWMARDGRIVARFWSRTEDVDDCSYEIFGLKTPSAKAGVPLDADRWVPAGLRWEYEDWVTSEFRG